MVETKDRWRPEPFVAPAGIRMVRVDRASGKRVFDGSVSSDPKAAVIWEAFKPDTEPPRITRADEIEKKRAEIIALIKRGRSAVSEAKVEEEADTEEGFVEEQGGLY